MEKQNKSGGILIPLLCILFIFLLWSWVQNGQIRANTISNTQLSTALEEEQVAGVVIDQARTVPTGSLEITMKDGNTYYMEVSDVNAAQNMLALYGVPVTVTAVPEQNVSVTIILPILLGVIIIVGGMFLITNRLMGGSSNNKMMNFGRSRARLVKDAANMTLDKSAWKAFMRSSMTG